MCICRILIYLKMTERVGQRYCIKFLQWLMILKAKWFVRIIKCHTIHQISSSFIAHNSDFLYETCKSNRSPISLLSRHGSFQLLVVSKIVGSIERILLRQKRWIRHNMMRWRSWSTFQNRPSKSVLGNGKNGGYNVWRHEIFTVNG